MIYHCYPHFGVQKCSNYAGFRASNAYPYMSNSYMILRIILRYYTVYAIINLLTGCEILWLLSRLITK